MTAPDLPDVPNGEDYQIADEYEPYFQDAVLPDDIAPYNCDHDANATVCACVHDWRIYWGNKPKVSDSKAIYITA